MTWTNETATEDLVDTDIEVWEARVPSPVNEDSSVSNLFASRAAAKEWVHDYTKSVGEWVRDDRDYALHETEIGEQSIVHPVPVWEYEPAYSITEQRERQTEQEENNE